MARLFFAVMPPAEAAAALHAWATRAQRGSGGRATPAASIHLTLAFLGEVTAARAQAAIDAARGVQAAPHELPIEVAEHWAHNAIVWAGPRATPPALAALAAALAAALGSAGFALERRPFAAHVTLLRKARAGGDLPALPRLAWPVHEFVLVRSTLDPAGSRYEILHRFPLVARAP